ncbi:Myb-like DNA-binding domain containing protein [Histomonas meleagridis]|uniref:Myb-like DNA-binding domain containing protein n=1 Tax=Histomonas meleagridis TaxID=135588 RepID=UPI0035594CDA|nr:Myb-like DNA-binding domain containing protein [Histomonas meleagridis]KAH0796323.1 Myb-like DNA-binding domain containing protein [Histomonas meleagridis]
MLNNENNQIQQQEADIQNQYANLQIDPSRMPALFQAFFQNQLPLDDAGKISIMGSRGSWTQQEDDLLRNAVQQVGTRKWNDIAKFVPTRTAKQCRERWTNRLSPELKHGPFEQWEDQVIIQKQKEVGNRWSLIAQLLPGRSSGSIKNRWYSSLKSTSQEMNIDPISEIPPQQTMDQI